MGDCKFGSVAWSKQDGLQCDLCLNTLSFFYAFAKSPVDKGALLANIQKGLVEKYQSMGKGNISARCQETGHRMPYDVCAMLGVQRATAEAKVVTRVKTSVNEFLGVLWSTALLTRLFVPSQWVLRAATRPAPGT